MNPYNCSGATIPEMIGRKGLFNSICNKLNKTSPDNLTIVGPKRYGKTVLLNHLASHLNGKNGYIASILIDLRHETPQSDAEFRSMLLSHFRTVIGQLNPDYAEMLQAADESTMPDFLRIILTDLNTKQQRIVIIFDGFDALPLGNGINTQLIDQLRSFAKIPSLKYVIGSRERLRELCKSHELRSSDFWLIFVGPIRVGTFDLSDYDELFQPLFSRSISIDPGAITEFKGQSGGIPLLTIGLLKNIYDRYNDGETITRDQLLEDTNNYLKDMSDHILEVWEDCSQDIRNILVDIATGEYVVELSKQLLEQAELRGLIRKDGRQFKHNSRMLEVYAKSQTSSVRDMNILFATKDAYEKNIKTILQLRLTQVNNISDDLTGYAQYSIRDMDDGPRRVLSNARGIVEEAIKVILSAEKCAVGSQLPNEWNDEWRRTNRNGPPDGIDPFPADRGKQIRALSYICGCDSSYIKVSNVVSRQTFILLRSVNELGNFMNHRGTEEPVFGTGVLLCFTAIELIESLSNDLSQI